MEEESTSSPYFPSLTGLENKMRGQKGEGHRAGLELAGRVPEQMLASCVSYGTGTCKTFWISAPGGGTSSVEDLHRKEHI